MNGIDVSAVGQGTVDFDALPADVAFVIAKATEGTGFVDPQFARNWSETRRTGRRRGAYHFAVPDLGSNAQDEARHFLSVLGPLEADAILVLDYERDWDGDVVGWCHQWLQLVRSVTGITPYVYLNLYLSHVYDWSAVIADGFPLWLADYDGLPDRIIWTPWPRVAIKQWTSSGTVAGVAALVDLNRMEDDMTAADVIAAIEADPALRQRVYDAIAPIIQTRVVNPEVDTETAMKALEQTILKNITDLELHLSGSMTDQHVAGVVLATLRGVFDGVAGDMPRPPFVAPPS